MLSDLKKQLLSCDPRELFQEWYVDEVEEESNGGREVSLLYSSSDTFNSR